MFVNLPLSSPSQIFSLNARLAAAESMTHDVIRDLLGVKLDMTTYVVIISLVVSERCAQMLDLIDLIFIFTLFL